MKRAALVLLALALLAAPVTALAQTFLVRYKAGVEAAERGDWPQVASHMRAAIEERPEAASRLVAHFHFRPYLPHHYLGLALAETGDCPGALQAFERSEEQGVVQDQPEEHARLRQAREGCRRRLEQRTEQREQAEAAIRAAAGELASLADERTAVDGEADAADWWRSGSPPPRLRHQQAEERLREARQALAQDPARARELADRAVREARRLRAEAAEEGERRQGRLRREAALAALAAGRERARRSLAEARPLRPYPDRLARRVDRVERLLAEAEEAGEESGLETLDRLAEELRNAAAVLARAAAPPPDSLLAAAEAFVAGRYREVLETVPEDGLPRGRSRVHGHLLRAAALFALDRSGERVVAPQSGTAAEGNPQPATAETADPAPATEAAPTSYREAALEELNRALALDPEVRPPERFHSPAFLAFLEEARSAGNGEQDGDAGAGPSTPR